MPTCTVKEESWLVCVLCGLREEREYIVLLLGETWAKGPMEEREEHVN